MKPKINLTAKAFAVIFASVNILCITACTKESNVVSDNNVQRQTSSSQSDATSVFTTSSKFDISILVFIPCANGGSGEDVLLEGTLHETFHLGINGNRFQLKIIDNPQGLRGIGQVTGDKYQATGETQTMINDRTFVNGVFTESYINNFKIIGQGPGNNFLIHENFHVTVNANGTVTALLDHLTADCK
jgi:hypothetical protein